MSFKKLTVIAFIITLTSIPAFFFASAMIPLISPNRPALDDLLFDILPFVPWLQYGADFFVAVALISIVIYLFPKRKEKLPQVVAAIGVMEWIRSFIVAVTPIGGPARPDIHYGITPLILNGPFPSGHTALVYMCYLFVDKKQAPGLKTVLLVSTIGEIISLIMSHGHYSIDVIGGLLLTYVVYDVFIRRKWFEFRS